MITKALVGKPCLCDALPFIARVENLAQHKQLSRRPLRKNGRPRRDILYQSQVLCRQKLKAGVLAT
jgi:hypothetical protein|tara:strand:- start:394 stop:591 length:198 start_codon:yes stop_codon:yes gene_type:complete